MAEGERALEKEFLRAAQAGALDSLTTLLTSHPHLLLARSSSKGYTAMHFAAMGGAVEVCEWLAKQGIDPEVEAPNQVTPIKVALEYKRLHAARRLQQMRDAIRRGEAIELSSSKKGGAPASPTVSDAAKTPAAVSPAHLTSSTRQAEKPAGTASSSVRGPASSPTPSPTPPVLPSSAPTPSPPESAASTTAQASAHAGGDVLSFANKEAAEQALTVGMQALRNGDLQRAVRLLNKAHALNPSDSEIGKVLREAEREMAAVQREMAAERLASSAAGRAAAAATLPSSHDRQEGRMEGGRRVIESASRDEQEPSGGDERRGEESGGEEGEEEEEQEVGGERSREQASLPARVGLAVLGLFLRLIHLLVMVGAWVAHRCFPRIGISWLASRVGKLGEWFESRWMQLLGNDFDLAERLSYLYFYWRARLRWPCRLLGVLFALVLAWVHPWKAYAVLVFAVSVLGVWLTPHMVWSGLIGRPAAGGIAAAVCLFCWTLPITSAWMLGLALWSLAMWTSWRFALGGSALLLVFYWLPSVALLLLCLVIWLLFLLTLPRMCVFITEMAVGTYFMPFWWPYLHALLFVLLLGSSMPLLLIPGGIAMILLFFFPRLMSGLVALFVLWQAYPIIKAYLKHLVDTPYGVLEGTAPGRIESSEEAVRVAHSGQNHYEVLNSHRAATTHELKACYKRMALMLHPDKNPEASAASAFKKVSDAWDSLSTPLNRAEYDASLDNALGEGDSDSKAEAEKEEVREFARSGDTSMPSGPPGKKKRKPKPTTKRH